MLCVTIAYIGSKSALLKVTTEQMSMTLRDLNVGDGDQFIAENVQVSQYVDIFL